MSLFFKKKTQLSKFVRPKNQTIENPNLYFYTYTPNCVRFAFKLLFQPKNCV